MPRPVPAPPSRALARLADLPIDRRTLLRAAGVAAALGAVAACAPRGSAPVPTPSPSGAGARFADGFLWGAATSAFQVEGSTTADGRGPSIWDTFAAQPGRIDDGSTGDPAADHYRRWEEDLDLVASLGLGSYRFSVAWPRVVPTGAGAVNQAGLDFYRRLVDGLRARGVRPAITLYHWDLPQPLQDAGGWAVRDTAERFGEYAAVVVDALAGEDVTWLTINEPKTTAFVGYAGTEHAPGLGDVDAGLAAVHHQLLGHGRAVQAVRASGPVTRTGEVGIALNLQPVYAGIAAEDAARRADGAENRLYLDPVLRGRYPDDAVGDLPGQVHGDADRFAALVRDGDLEAISSACDVLAVQYYGAAMVDRYGAWQSAFPASAAGWQQVHPEGLYDLLTRLRDDYPDLPPLLITENGVPDDPADTDPVHDAARIGFLRAHLEQAARAIADGVDLRGYYAWSLLDNFEWARGMTQRWGLVRVEPGTLDRTPKDSARWYQRVVASNGLTD